MSPSLTFHNFDARAQIAEARAHLPHLLDAFYGCSPAALSDAEVLCFLLATTGTLPELALPTGVELGTALRDPPS